MYVYLTLNPPSSLYTHTHTQQMYQVYQDVKYISPMVDDYGVDDVLNPMEEPFASTFTRLMEVRPS